jgi:hypothetical protein
VTLAQHRRHGRHDAREYRDRTGERWATQARNNGASSRKTKLIFAGETRNLWRAVEVSEESPTRLTAWSLERPENRAEIRASDHVLTG